jgi:hypothetical protein
MTRKALLVGINRMLIPGALLHGCVNDVQALRALLLERFGFADRDVTILTDLKATTKGIQGAFSSLLRGAKDGDALLFHYSGYGSSAPDRSGDEADYRAEVLCPSDIDWRAPLTLDWFDARIRTIPEGVSLTIILDCGFSGTNTRAFLPPDAPIVPRYLPNPLDLIAGESGRRIMGKVSRLGKVGIESSGSQRRGDVVIVDAPLASITACRPTQIANEASIGGTYHGVLTHHLITAIRQSKSPLSYRDLHQRVILLIKSTEFDQAPQLSGRKDILGLPFLELMSKQRL